MTAKASGGPALVIPWVLPVGEVWESDSEMAWLEFDAAQRASDHSVERPRQTLPLSLTAKEKQ